MTNTKRLTQILFGIYFLLLAWIILMKTELSFATIYRMRSLNLTPFAGTAVRNNQLDYQEIFLNVLIFMPFGLYLSMLKPHWPFFKKILPIFLVSFLFESLQYALSIGATDITDLLGNTLGGLLGILLYQLIVWGLKDHQKAQRLFNLLAGLVTFLFFLITVALFIANG